MAPAGTSPPQYCAKFRSTYTEIIGFELQDPRLAGVDVTDVHIAPDLKHARIRVVLNGGETEKQAALRALEHARHYMRRELARRLNLRKTPELHFEPDPWPGGEDRLETLLKRAKKMRGSAEKQP